MTATSNAVAANTAAPALKLTPTPGQTIGPFYGYALPFEKDNELVNQARAGSIRLHGVVTDGNGTVIPDALLEIWQADEAGNVVSKDGSLVRDGYTFTGWGRTAVDNVGHYTFTTLNPGATEAGKAPFIMLTVFARGLLNRLFTRIYLPEDTAALAARPAAGLAARGPPQDADRHPRGRRRIALRRVAAGRGRDGLPLLPARVLGTPPPVPPACTASPTGEGSVGCGSGARRLTASPPQVLPRKGTPTPCNRPTSVY